jgi:hypothetical protein
MRRDVIDYLTNAWYIIGLDTHKKGGSCNLLSRLSRRKEWTMGKKIDLTSYLGGVVEVADGFRIICTPVDHYADYQAEGLGKCAALFWINDQMFEVEFEISTYEVAGETIHIRLMVTNQRELSVCFEATNLKVITEIRNAFG